MFEYDRTTVNKTVWKRLIIGGAMFFGTLVATVAAAEPEFSYGVGGLTLPLLATFLISIVIFLSAITIKILFELGKTDETLMTIGTNLAGFGMSVAWMISLINSMFFNIWLFEGAYDGPAKMFFIPLDFNILMFPVGILMSIWVGANHGAVLRDLKLAENGDDEAQMRVARAVDPSSNNKIVDIMAEIGNMLNKK